MRLQITLTTIALVLLTAPASTPAEERGSDPVPKPNEIRWEAQAQAGLLMTAGNATTTTLSSALHASRASGGNQLVLDAGGAFARSTLTVASDTNGDRVISESEVDQISKTAARFWFVKPRYDRALDLRSSLYVAGVMLSDAPAGKSLVASGQTGYSRVALRQGAHTLRLESGYDFSHERFSAAGSQTLSIHSLRAFAGYSAQLSNKTSLDYSLEALFNLNRLAGPAGPIDPLGDRRFDSKLTLSTLIAKNVSFGFSFHARYDSAPAAKPALALPFADGFRPLADRLDTRTEAALIINLL